MTGKPCDECRGKGWVIIAGEKRDCDRCHGTGVKQN